jgi:hypothetical protein
MWHLPSIRYYSLGFAPRHIFLEFGSRNCFAVPVLGRFSHASQASSHEDKSNRSRPRCSNERITAGPHPVSYHRDDLNKLGVVCASDLVQLPDGTRTRISGPRLVTQRPGSANGFAFVSLEEETGISNAIIPRNLFEGEAPSITRISNVSGSPRNADMI